MNIPVAKPLCDMHNNICFWMKQQNNLMANKQLYDLERLINTAENNE